MDALAVLPERLVMQSISSVSLRSQRRTSILFATLVLAIFALAAGIMLGGPAWLSMVPAMFALGRVHGSPSEPQASGHGAEYGVGAALAGFTPVVRK